MSKGKFIVIEGGDGAGKSTFINALKEKHPEYLFCKQPGGDGTGISQKIREIVLPDEAKLADSLAMFCLFWASRAETTAKLIRPAIAEGRIVVSDRFDASTYAYQVGENPNLEDLFWSTRQKCLINIEPIYLNFDISVEVARSRMDSRDEKTHFDTRDDRYRNRVRTGYRRFFADRRIKSNMIDADQSKDDMIKSAYEVFQKIIAS